jgi:hypothetical protein
VPSQERYVPEGETLIRISSLLVEEEPKVRMQLKATASTYAAVANGGSLVLILGHVRRVLGWLCEGNGHAHGVTVPWKRPREGLSRELEGSP